MSTGAPTRVPEPACGSTLGTFLFGCGQALETVVILHEL